MVALGYELETVQLSLGERVRFCSVDWPANLAKLLAWSAREAMRDQVGRAPSPHTIISRPESART
jgi:hypothetical protein